MEAVLFLLHFTPPLLFLHQEPGMFDYRGCRTCNSTHLAFTSNHIRLHANISPGGSLQLA